MGEPHKRTRVTIFLSDQEREQLQSSADRERRDLRDEIVVLALRALSQQSTPSETRDSTDKLLLLPEAFKLMKVSRAKGYQMLAQGRIPGVEHLGERCKRVRRRVLERWLDQQDGE